MKIIKQFENEKDAAIIPTDDLSEFFWQAAIHYAYKYKFYEKKEEAASQFNKERAKQTASLVWELLGFEEKGIRERLKAFENTILRDGGTQESISDYFYEVLPLEEETLKGFEYVKFN